MADTSTWGYGTTLGYTTVGGNSWTTIAKIVEIDEKKIKRKVMKITTLDSPNNTEEQRAGLVEVQPFKFKMIWSKTDHGTLLTLGKAAAPNRDWKITLSDGSTIAGTGFISEISEIPKASNDEVYMDNIEITPTGNWIYTPAA